MSRDALTDPTAFDRANNIQILQSHSTRVIPMTGVNSAVGSHGRARPQHRRVDRISVLSYPGPIWLNPPLHRLQHRRGARAS
jgi:hypothetical protein